jgi:TusA-related sulfurtransferase
VREATARLDLRGAECPLPTQRTVVALREAPGRQGALVVVTDDAVCAADIPYQARRLGYVARTEVTGISEWTITLVATGAGGRKEVRP